MRLYLLARRLRPLWLLYASFGLMACCGLDIFSQAIPGLVAYALCVVCSLAGGLIPVIALDSAPRYAPRPELAGATIGFAMQGDSIGLMVGPAAGAMAAALLVMARGRLRREQWQSP